MPRSAPATRARRPVDGLHLPATFGSSPASLVRRPFGSSPGSGASPASLYSQDSLGAASSSSSRASPKKPLDRAAGAHREAARPRFDPARFSSGGTALTGYDRFSASSLSTSGLAGPTGAGSYAPNPSGEWRYASELHLTPGAARLSDGSFASFASNGYTSEASAAFPRAPTVELVQLEEFRATKRENQKLRQHNMLLHKQLARSEAAARDGGGAAAQHPCFGRLLADLGHKRLYLSSARQLVSTVPVWAKQRPCSEERVADIVKAKAARPQLIGSISAFEFQLGDDSRAPSMQQESGGLVQPSVVCPQPRAIFDGQHRAQAVARLLSPREPAALVPAPPSRSPPAPVETAAEAGTSRSRCT